MKKVALQKSKTKKKPRVNPVGRPTKYNNNRAGKIIEALALGNTRGLACKYAGISADAFAAWLKNKTDFSEAVMQAESSVEMIAVDSIVGSFNVNPQMALKYLERRNPKEWAETTQVKLSLDEGVSSLLEHLEKTVDPKTFGALSEALQSWGAGTGEDDSD
jgi:hypothetical protein